MPTNQPVLVALALMVLGAYIMSIAYAYTFDPKHDWVVVGNSLITDVEVDGTDRTDADSIPESQDLEGR